MANTEPTGLQETTHGYLRSNFEPARAFTSPKRFQERESVRPPPERIRKTDRSFHRRSIKPYLRLDTNDYSLDRRPGVAGRRVEVPTIQRQVTAVELGSGEVVASRRPSFAEHPTVTDPPYQALPEQLRGVRGAGSSEGTICCAMP